MTARDFAPCRFTPSTCMDDLCRSSDVGICGNEDPPEGPTMEILGYDEIDWSEW